MTTRPSFKNHLRLNASPGYSKYRGSHRDRDVGLQSGRFVHDRIFERPQVLILFSSPNSPISAGAVWVWEAKTVRSRDRFRSGFRSGP